MHMISKQSVISAMILWFKQTNKKVEDQSLHLEDLQHSATKTHFLKAPTPKNSTCSPFKTLGKPICTNF